MSVKLREKQLSNGQVSFYLDIYHNKARWYEFLDIHINKTHPKEQDKDKKRLAQEIRAKREHELIVEENGLTDKTKKNACFIKFFESYLKQKKSNYLYYGAYRHLERFTGNKPLPFYKLSAEWIKDYEKYLLGKVSNNTTIRYIKVLSGAINEAVRKKIINRNPWQDIPLNKKLKMQDIFRNSFTIDQLQKLSDNSDTIPKQIKQAYFFSCFTGLRWSDVNPLRWDEIIIKNTEQGQQYYTNLK